MESNKESRKGITTQAGLKMASNKYQRDNKKADLNKDGKLNPYEEARADAIQQAMAEDAPEQDDVNMGLGGLAILGGLGGALGGGAAKELFSGKGILGLLTGSDNPIPGVLGSKISTDDITGALKAFITKDPSELNEDSELDDFLPMFKALLEDNKDMSEGGYIKGAEEVMAASHGGMACGAAEGLMRDPVSGNEIPLGSSAKNVRDDIDIKISEGEYVLPADVVKWLGLRSIMDLEAEAKMGLMGMYEDGLIQYVDQEGSDRVTCPECGGEGCDHCDGKGYHESEAASEDDSEKSIETPDGNEIETPDVETDESVMEPEYPEEGDEGYYPSKNREFAEVKKPILKFII